MYMYNVSNVSEDNMIDFLFVSPALKTQPDHDKNVAESSGRYCHRKTEYSQAYTCTCAQTVL